MSIKIIYAAIATLTVVSTSAEAAGAYVPAIPRPVVAVPRPVVNTSSLTRINTVSHPGNFPQNTSTFTNSNGTVVMAISSISKTPAPATTSLPAGTVAPTGLILNYDSNGKPVSATLIGGPGQKPPVGPLVVPGGGKPDPSPTGGKVPGAQQGQNAQNGTNSQNSQQAQQGHQGSNCNMFWHSKGWC